MRKTGESKPLPTITEAEWVVMRVLWERAPLRANEVVAALEGQSAWKPKTGHTLLRRLVAKGALTYEKTGREFLFNPLVKVADCQMAEGRSFLDRVFGKPQLAPLLAAFVAQEALTATEIEELKRILDEARPAHSSDLPMPPPAKSKFLSEMSPSLIHPWALSAAFYP